MLRCYYCYFRRNISNYKPVGNVLVWNAVLPFNSEFVICTYHEFEFVIAYVLISNSNS